MEKEQILNTLKEVVNELSNMEANDAVNFLANETNLPVEECKNAYDFFMKIDVNNL
ncbi:MAG: hypothetical protein MJ245_03155 [Clostridia bacterium]|nr:hypothetical protein [Clostridia bacterium]